MELLFAILFIVFKLLHEKGKEISAGEEAAKILERKRSLQK